MQCSLEELQAEGLSGSASHVSFDPKMFENCASRVRGQIVDFDEGCSEAIGHIPEEQILAWRDAMSNHCRHGLGHIVDLARVGKVRASRYSTEHSISAVRICGLLRNDTNLQENVSLIGRLLGFPSNFLQETVVLPSPATVSRHRFTLDSAYCLLIRTRLRSWIDSGIKFIVVMLWASSPRAGREWLLGECYIIREDMLEQFVNSMYSLARHRAKARAGMHDFDDEAAREWASRMNECVWHLIFTPVALGAKAKGLAEKFCACLHAIRLICDSWQMVQIFCESCINLCTDLGTESVLES